MSAGPSSSFSLLLSSVEGEELRRSVLIRNAVKAATSMASSLPNAIHSSGGSRGEGSHRNNNNNRRKAIIEKEAKERWIVMASRAGLHPSDFVVEEEQDDEVALDAPVDDDDDVEEEEEEEDADSIDYSTQQIQLQDYYPIDVDDDDQDESTWFEGLLQEVRADQQETLSASVEEDGQMSLSLTPSLPSLVVDDDDDDSSEEEDEDEDSQSETISKESQHCRSPTSACLKRTGLRGSVIISSLTPQ